MAKKDTWQLEDWLLLFGGVWLISELFKTAQQAGIGSLKGAERFLYSYYSADGVNMLEQDMSHYNKDEQGEIVRLIIKARLKPELSEPLYKSFPGSKEIDGEIRDLQNGWRIFCKKLPEGDFLMLSVFKKKSQKTPQHEKDKAEQRTKEWEAHKTLVRKS
ncbi:MAG: type II toxin-antitoxin system RelE/ParE family toxin [Bacteroidetes bacterium]|jgi:Phage-related protein|uniref:type II toxin-antitoxin system RelE/ParE family toxin n=1 Tax=Phnomibacter sp. TaxID=2836217 RepID=UPI002FDDA84C|nr:type II toxin-antitoxin system RelE/ParE family toxin [Bacteroidota bacterium]